MGADPHLLLAFVTLTLLEIVLGVDNVIFIALTVERLPASLQARARSYGLFLAMLTRIALLSSVVWMTRLTTPLFELVGRGFSGRDLVLLGGGLFLLAKSVLEIHRMLEGGAAGGAATPPARARVSVMAVSAQIAVIDIVFSLDSVFTAVGLVRELPVMVAAIVASLVVMLFVARGLGAFIARHPTVKVLALAFLLLIGLALVCEGVHFEIPKGYLYFAMAFSVGVELVNVRVRRRQDGKRTGR